MNDTLIAIQCGFDVDRIEGVRCIAQQFDGTPGAHRLHRWAPSRHVAKQGSAQVAQCRWRDEAWPPARP